MKVNDLINILEKNPDCLLCTALISNPAYESDNYPAFLSDFYLSNINPCKKDVLVLGFYHDTPDLIMEKYTASRFLEQLKNTLPEDDYNRDVWCTISNAEFSFTYPDVYFAQSKVDKLKYCDIKDHICRLFVEYLKEPICV